LDWHTVKALEPVGVKCVAVVSTAGDPRAALAVEPDDRPLDTGVQHAALAVVQVEASSSVSRLTGGRIPRGAGVGEGAAVRVGRDDGWPSLAPTLPGRSTRAAYCNRGSVRRQTLAVPGALCHNGGYISPSRPRSPGRNR
jgi:hypothetical protein